jgi:hypothetical protein
MSKSQLVRMVLARAGCVRRASAEPSDRRAEIFAGYFYEDSRIVA